MRLCILSPEITDFDRVNAVLPQNVSVDIERLYHKPAEGALSSLCNVLERTEFHATAVVRIAEVIVQFDSLACVAQRGIHFH